MLDRSMQMCNKISSVQNITFDLFEKLQTLFQNAFEFIDVSNFNSYAFLIVFLSEIECYYVNCTSLRPLSTYMNVVHLTVECNGGSNGTD